MAEALALSTAEADELRRYPIGERVRRLRERLGHEGTQSRVREEMGRIGVSRSTGWLSNIESGVIALQKDHVEALGAALRLSPQDLDLIDPEGTSPMAADQVRYAAWQTVRLQMAEGFAQGLAEAKPSWAVVAEVVAADASLRGMPKNWQARNLRESVRRFVVDDPEGPISSALRAPVRWMLFLEGLYMDPYAPLRPNTWKTRRRHAIDPLGSALDLLRGGEAEAAMLKRIRGIRGNASNARQVPPAAPGLAAVQGAINDETDLDIVAGGSLVGEYGWQFACGMYLLDIERALAQPLQPWTPASRRRRTSVAARPRSRVGNAQIARLIWAIGRDTLRNDLAKLNTLVEIGGTCPDAIATGDQPVGLHPETVQFALKGLHERVLGGKSELHRMNDTFHEELKASVDLIKDAAEWKGQ